MWDARIFSLFPSFTPKVLKNLRNLLLRWYRRKIFREFLRYLKFTYKKSYKRFLISHDIIYQALFAKRLGGVGVKMFGVNPNFNLIHTFCSSNDVISSDIDNKENIDPRAKRNDVISSEIVNKENIDQINTYDQMIQDERSRDKDQQDTDYILNLERQTASLRASQESLNRDYRDLSSKKESMLKNMKGTREQRIKRLEDSKQSFTSWVAALMQNPELIKQYGIEMEKMRAAMAMEKGRLGEFHEFTDGQVDQPFLTPDTVKD